MRNMRMVTMLPLPIALVVYIAMGAGVVVVWTFVILFRVIKWIGQTIGRVCRRNGGTLEDRWEKRNA